MSSIKIWAGALRMGANSGENPHHPSPPLPKPQNRAVFGEEGAFEIKNGSKMMLEKAPFFKIWLCKF